MANIAKNEIINEEVAVVVKDVVAKKGIRHGAGPAVLIVAGLAGLTALVGVGVKLGKKLVETHKAKTELRQPTTETYVEPEQVVEVATKK